MKTKYYLINSPWLKVVGVLLFIGALAPQAHAQKTYYQYDNNGNRITSDVLFEGGALVNNHDTTYNDTTHNVTVYPNPTTGELNVVISSFQGQGYATIYLSDASGNLLAMQKATSTITPLNMINHQQGTYYLRTIIGDKQYYCKVIKINPGSGVPSTVTPHSHPDPVKY